ncbi:hypothetical protein ACHAWF_009830 [Thalassiosira exigua]
MTNPEMTQKSTSVAVPVADEAGGLGEPLLAAEARPYLEVVAPAKLPEGYTFEAEVDGRSFKVKVPAGGVEEGQRFTVPFPDEIGGSGQGLADSTEALTFGYWKDGLFDCCQFGCIHSVLCNAWCCPLVLLGQIMTRLKLNWLGYEDADPGTSTFQMLLGITIGYFILRSLINVPVYTLFAIDAAAAKGGTSVFHEALIVVQWLLDLSFTIFTIFLVYNTRRYIRDKYRIPERNCKGCEDCCCAYWCTCCTVAQMARHTADYETYAAKCCSSTGLSPNAPSGELPMRRGNTVSSSWGSQGQEA